MGDNFDNTGLISRAWFKPAVATWFAVLAGGGLWLMPPRIHDSIASVTGMSQFGTMFAPPLGAGGTAILCLLVAVLAALLGWALAGRLVAANSPRGFAPGFGAHPGEVWQDDRSEDFEQPRRRRVFSAREDIPEEGIAAGVLAEDADEPRDEAFVEESRISTPEQDFDAVYAQLEPGYIPQEEPAETNEHLAEASYDPAAIDEAEYTEIEDTVEEDTLQFVETSEIEPDREPQSGQEPRGGFEGEFDPETAPEMEATPEEIGEQSADVTLDALLGRLEGALETHKTLAARSELAAKQPGPEAKPTIREPVAIDSGKIDDDAQTDEAENDPMIAFLQREASRRMAPPPSSPDEEDQDDENFDEGSSETLSQTDAQVALRNALDRLSHVKRRD